MLCASESTTEINAGLADSNPAELGDANARYFKTDVSDEAGVSLVTRTVLLRLFAIP